jgi:hypothetical protein
VNGSVPMAIYEFLTRSHAQRGTEGWGYPSLADELSLRTSPVDPATRDSDAR